MYKNYIFTFIIIIIFSFILIIIGKKLSIENYVNNKSKMKKYNVIFAGTCRSIEPYIKKILEHIDNCGKKFNSYYLIVYENDSTDKTREILENNKKGNYFYIFEDNIKEERRTVRLERGRNLILDKVKELNKDNNYEYLIMIDLDNVNRNGTFVKTIDNCPSPGMICIMVGALGTRNECTVSGKGWQGHPLSIVVEPPVPLR